MEWKIEEDFSRCGTPNAYVDRGTQPHHVRHQPVVERRTGNAPGALRGIPIAA